MRVSLLAAIAIASLHCVPAAQALTKRDCAEMAAETERNVVAFNQMVDALRRKTQGKQLSEMATGRVKAAAAEAEKATVIMMPDLRAYAAAMDALAIELRSCAK